MNTVIKPRPNHWGYVGRHGRHSRTKQDAPWYFSDNHRHECVGISKDFSVAYGSVLKKVIQDYPLIAMDDNVLCGSPRIAGTRVPVYMVLDAAQHYGTVEGVKESYPQLTTEQVKEAISFAGALLEQPIEYEP